jgi:virS homolog
MTIYNVADMLTGLVEAIMAFLLFGTFCTKRDNLPKWTYYIGIIILTILINLSNAVFNNDIFNAVGMSAAFFIISFLYKGNIPVKIIISVLSFLLIVITEIIVLFGITLIYDITVAEAVNIPSYRLLGIIVSKILVLLIANIIRFKYKDRSFIFKPTYWLLFFLIFATSIVAVFLIFRLSFGIDNEFMYNLSVLCSFGLLFSTFFALYLYEHLAKQAEMIRNQEQYEQHLKMQLKHLDEILITQKQIKKFKHDFNNYTIGLQAYIDDHDFQGANEYINKLKETFAPGEDIVETGNTALDAILSTKIAIAKSKGIVVDTKIQIPEKLSVDPIDICIIFGNSLDNAIEACERTHLADKKISITILCKDEAVFCKIINPAPKPKNSLLHTSKADKKNHGFGLENIRTALSKYNAVPGIERTDTEFVLKFVIFTEE